MSKNSKNVAGVLAGLLAGAAVGIVLGLLYAPEEGKETRKKIKHKANELKDEAIDQYGNLSSQVRETAQSLTNSVKEGYEKYKDQAASKIADVAKSVESKLDGMQS